MFNPFFGTHEPVKSYDKLDEEQLAQKYGHTAHFPSIGRKLALQLGRLFFRIGEKLTHEDPCIELTRETA